MNLVLTGIIGSLLALIALVGVSWLLATLETTSDPPRRPRAWYRRRKRAVCLGDMGHTKAWYDPVTDELWQANDRWSLFTVDMTNDNAIEVVEMLETVHMAEAYVSPNEVGWR